MFNFRLVLLLSFLVCGCSSAQVELVSDVSEMDANEIISSLHKSGIEGTKTREKDGSSVIVDVEYLAQAVALLKAQGLPAQKYDSLGEVFEKEGMISTPLEEKARYIYALSQEFERTISQMDGVLIARVHLVLSETNRIGQQIQTPSAAVFVKHLPELDPDTIAQKVKRIVIHGTPGLNAEDANSVSVSFVAANVTNVEMKWVDVWGFRMTDRSAVQFKASVKRVSIIASVIGSIGFIIVFIRFLRKSKRKVQVSA